LLRVLLAEVRALGPDEVEQLQADRRDPAEVTGSRLPLGSSLVGLDPGGEARRIQLVRREDDVDSLGLGELEIARLVPGIRVEIRLLVELRRIDEQRRDDSVVLRPRRAE